MIVSVYLMPLAYQVIDYIFFRHTSIRKLFGLPYSRSVQGDQSEELAKTVGKYVDEACQGSCLVFVDGVFSSVLSQLDNIPDGLVLGGLKFLTAEQRQELQALSSDGFLQRMAHVPDVNEAPRDSFGSEALTLLNLVSGHVNYAVCRGLMG